MDNTKCKHCCIWDRWAGALYMVNHKYFNLEVTGTFVLNTPSNVFYLKKATEVQCCSKESGFYGSQSSCVL